MAALRYYSIGSAQFDLDADADGLRGGEGLWSFDADADAYADGFHGGEGFLNFDADAYAVGFHGGCLVGFRGGGFWDLNADGAARRLLGLRQRLRSAS